MMETGLAVLWGGGLVTLCLLCWGLNLIALPGNWFGVAVVAIYAAWGPAEGLVALGWQTAAVCFGCAVMGEIFEFLAGAVGAQRAGASRRATLYALLGSIIGAVAGGIIGVPIPILGSIIAALVFGALGATAGAMYGEWTNGKSWRESWTVGHAAFWGRIVGTIGKLGCGAAQIVVVIVGVLRP